MSSKIVRKIISSDKLGKPLGPLSTAVVVDRTVYISGCLGVDKNTQAIVPGGVLSETKKALENLGLALEAADSGFEKVLKVTIFLNDINDFAVVNEEYKRVFSVNPPARSCFQVGKLPRNGLVEIEAVALTGNVETVLIHKL